MSQRNRERGIIKGLVVVTLALCGGFIVLAVLSKSLGGIGQTAFNSLSNSDSLGTVEIRTNPLLNFGDGSTVDSEESRIAPAQSKFDSPYAGKVTISSGSASYAYQPMDEYIVLRNSGSPVNITGWWLENGKGTRPVETSYNSYFYPAPDKAVIGSGVEFLDPSGVFKTGGIVLGTDESAIVTTGKAFAQFKFPVYTSFKENKCTGYLRVYPFEPPLTRACPYASADKDVRFVTDQCYDYLKSIDRCEDPEEYDKENFDRETSICKNFMRERFNYPSCVSLYRSDADFYLDDWRVFLGRSTEMWASDRETITLYDGNGKIVDRVTY